MARNKSNIIELKKEQWVSRTSKWLRVSEETTRHLLSIQRQQSLRINPLINDPKSTIEHLRQLDWVGEPVQWSPLGYTITNGLDSLKTSRLLESGAIYIQNSASWIPVLALDVQKDDTILDVCAAPGGKTSHISSITYNSATITANDNSRPRLAKLRSNLARLGVKNVEYTLYDATRLATKLDGRQYDKILIDAPCSGEGMMSLSNDKSFTTWSVAHIKRLQQVQKKILTQAWQLLKPGGTLVYSTCTMAPEENEAVVDYLLRRYSDAWVQQIKLELKNRVNPVDAWNGKKFSKQLQFSIRLIPSHEAEAFFVCKLTKIKNTIT